MKRLGFAPAARRDLAAIESYIAADNAQSAAHFVEELIGAASTAAERPRSFPQRDDLSPGLRVVVYGRYLIFFRDLATEVRVVRVLHSARDLKPIFRRR